MPKKTEAGILKDQAYKLKRKIKSKQANLIETLISYIDVQEKIENSEAFSSKDNTDASYDGQKAKTLLAKIKNYHV